ncbi:response regulator [Opacimonas viscosa]|mgnify:CR=1 FL=1|uniref:Response regulator n=1 Tax=Opacimonas viscosa TaxID=2961944 RepID=A0AA41X5T6_9ALTE|nr:response regulator [Opacimonas viscosa]MCP3429149.1 response regulator [Opacimonas viscosa]
MHILLVEDELELARGIQTSLRLGHYAVSHIVQGKEAILAAESGDCDLMVLDLGLPDMDGLEVLKVIRAKKIALPIIILTARDNVDDKIKGLDAGADDYLAKPFAVDELLARVRVIERRLGNAQTAIITKDSVTINTQTHTVTVANSPVTLAKKEYMILRALLERIGHIISKSQLESALYAWGDEIASNTIEVHIHNLRKKLPPNFITTIRGVGYSIQ